MSPVHPSRSGGAATARAVVDESGVLVQWNEHARRLLGYEPGEAEGRPAAELLVPGEAVPAPEEDCFRWSGTVGLRHRDGHAVRLWLLAHHRPEHGGEWLVVTPLGSCACPDREPLMRSALEAAPCALAVYDEDLRLCGVNEAMTGVLGLPEENIRGLRPSELSGRLEGEEIERQAQEVLDCGRGRDVQTYMRSGGEDHAHAWLVRLAPLTDGGGRVRGVCMTAHDFSDQYLARERLQLVNEASVRIGTALDVTRTAQELADVCVPALADFVSVDLLDPPADGSEPGPAPAAAPVTLRRAAHQSVTPGCPEALVEPGQVGVYPDASPQADSLVTGRTIVAADAATSLTKWLDRDPARRSWVHEFGVHSTMSVPIMARGGTFGVAVLTRFRRPDPFTPDDVLLAEEITARAAVCIDNARRFSRERRTALALQRSLLPRTLPRTAALDAASRYLPAARAGVGGDWFDLIPLSGMRVAMVVGDVVGRGIQASATMGRLRTAVQTLADIDLAPDELLTHLDDLVVRLSQETGPDGAVGEVGATCLYVVYDPVSRRCSLARAGHPAPVVMPPDEPPREIKLPSGPPLGLGGLPFESAEVDLPVGTVLGLYTDGLVEGRDRDADASRRLLCSALAAGTAAATTPDAGPVVDVGQTAGAAQVTGSLDDACDRILQALLPQCGINDDVALLLARTHGLPASQVATWDIFADPALVAAMRRHVVGQLSAWNLNDSVFTAELVVSELATNAIRYADPPIRLRLIHDATTLICEVSDSSHTAPHLRRARAYDEGGRGLLLVSQLTQRWGSRHTAEGKTIWAELSLLDE
ncbi:SpoIIE family protein phosphatase [Streptomyces sp. NPDC047022]|uniref:SpoIIE family protein phosphatase n=1 Tax=Streptomyces sp. NPDC047022 TaxID=3155737 RepID=UPI0034096AC3